jgi:hypothetical protein
MKSMGGKSWSSADRAPLTKVTPDNYPGLSPPRQFEIVH